MDMNTAGILDTGFGGKQDLIMVIQVAKVLMETEIGVINGEVMYSSLFPIDAMFCKDYCNSQEVEVVEINVLILTVAPNHFLRLKCETLEIMYSILIQFQFCPQVCTVVVNFIYGLMDMIITNIQTTMRKL